MKAPDEALERTAAGQLDGSGDWLATVAVGRRRALCLGCDDMDSHASLITEVRNTLQRVLDGTDGVYELDDRFSVAFADLRLENMRQRLWRLPDEFPPETKGRFCGQAGMEIIRGWIQDLSHDNAA